MRWLLHKLEGAPLPKNPVMVTFDDGYRSCHDVALPILRAVGMRAVGDEHLRQSDVAADRAGGRTARPRPARPRAR